MPDLTHPLPRRAVLGAGMMLAAPALLTGRAAAAGRPASSAPGVAITPDCYVKISTIRS